MVRNSPMQVQQNLDCSSIKSKRFQHTWLRYVADIAAHHSRTRVVCCDQNMAVNCSKHLQMSLFSCKMWLCLTLCRCRHWFGRTQPGGVTKSQLVLYVALVVSFRQTIKIVHQKQRKNWKKQHCVSWLCHNIINAILVALYICSH